MKLFFLILLLYPITLFAQVEKPNIIWVMLEDISTDFSCYGMPDVQTPTFDQLAEEGTLYTNCFGTASICSTNRSAMMIGVHQRKLNMHHHRSNRDVALADPYKPFTYWLKKEGYTTILGHKEVMKKGRKTDCNFAYKPIGTWDDNKGLFDKYDHFEKEDQPFFNQIQLNVTHRGDWWDKVRSESKHPIDPSTITLPPELADHPKIRLDWAKYLDQLEYADQEMKGIIEELKAKGMYENTVIIVIGDNGRCNVRGKGYLHDEGARIPLIVKWAYEKRSQKRSEQLISSTDITATILDLAGVELPDYLTGQSFIQDKFKRDFIYSYRGYWDEVEEEMSSVTDSRFRYIRNGLAEKPFDQHQAYLEFYRPAVHIMRQMYANDELTPYQSFFFEDQKPKEEFYDLLNDRNEENNLVDNKKYKELLDKFRTQEKTFDKEMTPISTTFHHVKAKSVKVLEFVKKNYPTEYKKMVDGDEIGFGKYVNEYKKQMSN